MRGSAARSAIPARQFERGSLRSPTTTFDVDAVHRPEPSGSAVASQSDSGAALDKEMLEVRLACGTLSGSRLPLVREDCARKEALSFYLRREYQ